MRQNGRILSWRKQDWLNVLLDEWDWSHEQRKKVKLSVGLNIFFAGVRGIKQTFYWSRQKKIACGTDSTWAKKEILLVKHLSGKITQIVLLVREGLKKISAEGVELIVPAAGAR